MLLERIKLRAKSYGNSIAGLTKMVVVLRLESSKQKKLIADKNDKLNAVSENDLKTEKKHWWQSLF